MRDCKGARDSVKVVARTRNQGGRASAATMKAALERAADAPRVHSLPDETADEGDACGTRRGGENFEQGDCSDREPSRGWAWEILEEAASRVSEGGGVSADGEHLVAQGRE